MGNHPDVQEQQGHARRQIPISIRVASAAGQSLPNATCIDVSAGGMLIAFDEPIGFARGHRLVVSLDMPGGHFHAVGAIVRTDRGENFRTLATIEFLSMTFEDFAELTRQLELLDVVRTRVLDS